MTNKLTPQTKTRQIKLNFYTGITLIELVKTTYQGNIRNRSKRVFHPT